MRFVYGQGWVHGPQDENDGAAGGGGAAGGEPAGGADDAPGGEGDGTVVEEVPDDGNGTEGGDKAAGAGKKSEAPAADPNAPKTMLEAISRGLDKKKEPPVDDKKQQQQKPAEEKHPNGKPKKDAQGNELDDKGQIVKKAAAPKAKTSAELDMKPEELKKLGAQAQQRFREVISTLKAHEGTITKLSGENQTLTRARDSLFAAMDDAKMSKDDLAGYLEFHAMMSSGDPKMLTDALVILNNQRAEVMKALGKDGDGFDALADFPDLKKKVEDEVLSREDAVEIATGRRRAQATDKGREQQQNKQRTENDAAARHKEASTKAMGEINAWCNGLSTSDLDYKAKEAMLLEPQGDQPAILDSVMKDYPPNLWLPTLKMLYAGLKVQKQQAPNGGDNTLRPSGARGGHPAPKTMHEALWGPTGVGAKQG